MDWRRHGYTKKSLSAAFFTFQRSGFLCETLHGRDHFTGEAPAMNGGSPPYARHANFKVSWNKKHQQKGEMRMAGSGYSDWMYKNPRGSYWKFGSRIRSFWGILQKKTSIKGPLVFFFMWEILLRVSGLGSCLLHRGNHRRWGQGRKVEETNGMENPLGYPKAGDGGALFLKGVTLDD